MITYKKFSVFLLVGVLILSSGFFNAKTAQAAALAPTSVVYLDTNSNGQVDTVRISFTDVTACTYEAGDWAVGIAGTIGVTAVTGIVNLATCATSDEFIDVSVTASAGITGGATNPRIDYTDAVTAGNVVADGNQDAANFTAVDAAGPAIVSAVTLGPNNFQINFSEAILESSLADGDLEYQNTASGGDSAITDANVDPDTDALFFVVTNTATFAVDETTGEVHFSAAGVISDIPGNTNTQTADVTITDGIAPEVLSAVTADIDSNGQIDTLVVAYTENVDDPNYDAVEVDGYVLLGTGTDSGTDILFYDLTESGTADTGATPALNWTPANAEDLNGNILDDFTFPFPTTATDQALPVLLSAVYDDLDSDGMVDTILTVWSEDVIMNGSTAADWTITGGSINAVFGSVADDGVPDTILGITVTANAGETGGAVNPTIAYDNGDANDSVRDVPSNFAGTNVAVSASDGADPVVTITVSEPLISITDDGNAFDVIFTFSEIMDSTTFPTVGFSENVIGSGVLESATCTDNWSTDVVTDDTYTLSCDIDGTVGVEFTGVDVTADDAEDLFGNFLPATTTNNLFDVDTIAPTVTVTMDDASMNIGDTSTVTFTFSEAPVSFTSADVTVANGTIGAINTANPLVQTAVFTPTNGIVDATNVITVGTAWTDAALNTGVGDDSPNYMIDTTAPATPVASPVAGTYTSTQGVTLSSTGSTSIRFTTDGTTPTCVSGILYTGGFNVSSTRTVKAVGCLSGNASPVGSFAYTLNVSSGGGSSGGSISKATVTPVVAPASAGECKLGDLFSTTSGKPCPPPAPDCTATTAYSASTGQLCPVISPPSPAPVPTPQFIGSPEYFTRNLTINSIGEDVRRLQVFLNTRGFILISFGLGSPGNETARFGTLTRAALARFQAANGIAPPVGFFGPITRALINSRL